MMKKILLLLGICLFVCGCGSTNTDADKKMKIIKNDYSFVEIDNKEENKNIKVETISLTEDFTGLAQNIDKAVGYDISIKNDGKTISDFSEKIRVGVVIPEGFGTRNLQVLYVENNEVKETYSVQVEAVDDIKYAVFETKHFSKYVLIKKVEEKETDSKGNSSGNNKKTDSDKKDSVSQKNDQSQSVDKIESSKESVSTGDTNSQGAQTPSSEPNFDAVPQHQVTIIPRAVNVPEGAKMPELPSFTHPFRAEISQTTPIGAEVNFSYCQIGVVCNVYYKYDSFWGEPVKMLPKNFTFTLEASI